jgi:hypothetical protein
MPRDKRTKLHLRERVAVAAARLIAEDGVLDYAVAKRKAARQLGMDDLHVLPDNDQIEEALRIHQSLYEGDELEERVRYLREEALRAMQLLADFRPYLRGSVLKGTSSRYNGIELQLFAEDSKALELFLLNRSIPYEVSESRSHGPQDRGVPVFKLDWEDIPLSLTVYPLNDERISGAGRGAERASATALQQLLEAEPPPSNDGESL